MRQAARLARAHLAEHEGDRAVDRALLDEVPAQLAILGVQPGAGPVSALLSVRPGVDAVPGGRGSAEQEVAVLLVSDQRPVQRVVAGGAAEVGLLDEPVVMEEDDHPPHRLVGPHLEVPEEPVAGHVDVVGEVDGDAVAVVARGDVGYQRVLRVAEVKLPARVVQPGEAAVQVEAGPAEVAGGVVLQPDLGMEDVADGVVGVEGDQRVAVADDDAARHFSP